MKPLFVSGTVVGLLAGATAAIETRFDRAAGSVSTSIGNPPAQQTPPAKLAAARVALLEQSPIILTVAATRDLDDSLTLFARNDEPSTVMGHFGLILRDTATMLGPTVQIEPDSSPIPPGIQPLTVRIHSADIHDRHVYAGFLVLTLDSAKGWGAETRLRPIRIVGAPAASAAANCVLLIGLVLGLLVVIVGVASAGSSVFGKNPPPLEAGWDAEKSWAANIAIFGILLNYLLVSIAPTAALRYMLRGEYIALAGLATALGGIAPALTALFSKAFLGPVLSRVGFVIASFTTLAAAFTQLVVLFALFLEALLGHWIPSLGAWIGLSVVGVSGLSLVVYAVRAIRSALKDRSNQIEGAPVRVSLI